MYNDDNRKSPHSQSSGNLQGQPSGGSSSQHQGQGLTQERSRSQRVTWSLEEYKCIVWCYEYGKMTGKGSTKEVYELWRSRNQNVRLNIDSNKLANQRRYILQNNKISPEDLTQIQNNVRETIAKEIEEATHGLSESSSEDEEDITCFHTPNSSPTRITASERLEIKNEILTELERMKGMSLEHREALRKANVSNKLLQGVNDVLKDITSENELSLTDLNHLIYATASVITTKIVKDKPKSRPEQKKNKYNASRRIENQIQNLRTELSLLTEHRNGKIKKKHMRVKPILKKYEIKSADQLNEKIEYLKQKITAKAQRRRRFERRSKQFKQNVLFESDQKKFYRSLKNENADITTCPNKEELEGFWGRIFEREEKYNRDAAWLNNLQEKEDCMQWTAITSVEVKQAIKSVLNWKSPGIDKIPNFWLKKLTSLHESLAREFNIIITQKIDPPPWFTQGKTVLIPKKKEPSEPKDYRPITCLTTTYKLFTSIIASRVGHYMRETKAIPAEQKGCCRDSAGCKDQLMMSSAILHDCKNRKGNLVQAWIDYQKAFDSIPHDWLLKALKLYGVATEIVEVWGRLMRTWRTKCYIETREKTVETRSLQIKTGIFQGDSLSPLLFCIALIPLSQQIRDLNYGYKLQNSSEKISHLFYMDDLKIFCKAKTELRKIIDVIKRYSADIRMKFGVDKCATLAIRAGKVTNIENIGTEQGDIKQLDGGAIYKYLGIDENIEVDHSGMKNKLKKEYRSRVRSILKTELNAKNKMSAIGALAVPVLQYSFGIVNWKMEEIREIDRKTRKILTMYKANHPKASVDRLYVQRKCGGRGLKQVESAFRTAIINTAMYLQIRGQEDKIVKIIKEYDEISKGCWSIKRKAEQFMLDLEIKEKLEQLSDLKAIKAEIKKASINYNEENWYGKTMYGQYIRELDKSSLNKQASLRWLIRSGLKIETESFIIAAQDQALNTRYRQNRICGQNVNPKCRICQQCNETIHHILSSCSVLAKNQYIERHDKIARLLHYNICKYFNIRTTKNWYEHVPKAVQESSDEKVTIIWNMPVTTDRYIAANKPDILIKQRNSNCLIIDIAIPADGNVSAKEAEKLLKYSDLKIEIQRMWNIKADIIPIVIGATGGISNMLQNYVKKLPGEHSIDSLQKTALIGSSNILRKCLMN